MNNLHLLYIYILKQKYKCVKTTYYPRTNINKMWKGCYEVRLQHPTMDFTTDLLLWEPGLKDS